MAAEKQRTAYYAGAPFVRFPRSDEGPVLDYLAATGARYPVVETERLDRDPALRQAARDGMRLLHTAHGEGRRVSVYAVGNSDPERELASRPH